MYTDGNNQGLKMFLFIEIFASIIRFGLLTFFKACKLLNETTKTRKFEDILFPLIAFCLKFVSCNWCSLFYFNEIHTTSFSLSLSLSISLSLSFSDSLSLSLSLTHTHTHTHIYIYIYIYIHTYIYIYIYIVYVYIYEKLDIYLFILIIFFILRSVSI